MSSTGYAVRNTQDIFRDFKGKRDKESGGYGGENRKGKGDRANGVSDFPCPFWLSPPPRSAWFQFSIGTEKPCDSGIQTHGTVRAFSFVNRFPPLSQCNRTKTQITNRFFWKSEKTKWFFSKPKKPDNDTENDTENENEIEIDTDTETENESENDTGANSPLTLSNSVQFAEIYLLHQIICTRTCKKCRILPYYWRAALYNTATVSFSVSEYR